MGDFVFVDLHDQANRRFVEEQAKALGFADEALYVESLIDAERKAAEKEKAIAKLKALIQEGLDSGPPILLTEEYWEASHRRIVDRHG